MLFIGERLNGMFRAVKKAIEERDKKAILEIAEKQMENGAHYLDINVGPVAAGAEAMEWMVNTVQEIGDVKLSIDSAKVNIIEAGLKLCKNRPILNSITADDEKISSLLPIAKKFGAQVIALTMDDKGVPSTAEGRTELAAMILAAAQEYGFSTEDIYLDPLILPVNVAQDCPLQVLKAIAMIRELDVPSPKTILGLSNVSQKCASRELINRTFLAMAMYCGLDAAILDTNDTELVNTAITSRMLLNKDIYCDSYLSAFRKNG